MRRLRVSVAMRKALAELKRPKNGNERGGIMLVPRMLSVEEWSALAEPMQRQLVEEARDDVTTVVIPHAGSDPADVTHRYKTQR